MEMVENDKNGKAREIKMEVTDIINGVLEMT